VKDRKSWAKFGDVVSVPKGEHKQGDYQVENAIEIQNSGE